MLERCFCATWRVVLNERLRKWRQRKAKSPAALKGDVSMAVQAMREGKPSIAMSNFNAMSMEPLGVDAILVNCAPPDDCRAGLVEMAKVRLREHFANDPERLSRLSVEAAGFYLDLSKNLVSPNTIELLVVSAAMSPDVLPFDLAAQRSVAGDDQVEVLHGRDAPDAFDFTGADLESVVRIEFAAAVDRQVSDRESFASLQIFKTVEDGVMLERGDNDVLAVPPQLR